MPSLAFPDRPASENITRRCMNEQDPDPWKLASWVTPMREAVRVPIDGTTSLEERYIALNQPWVVTGRNDWEDHLVGVWGAVRMRVTAYGSDGRPVRGSSPNSPITSTYFGARALHDLNVNNWLAPGDVKNDAFTAALDSWMIPEGTTTIAIKVAVVLTVAVSMMDVEHYGQSANQSLWHNHSDAAMLQTRRAFVVIPSTPFARMIEDQLRVRPNP